MKRPDVRTTPHGGYKYTQPETGVLFHYNTWAQIVEEVAKHRRAMGLDLADGFIDRLMHDFCVQNAWLGCPDDERPVTSDTPLAIAGRAAWLELHSFTAQYAESPNEDDITKAKFWMSGWRERIPRFGGCTCREDWARLVASFPPDYSSREKFYRWSVEGHDWVNKRIGKPLFRPDWFEVSPAKEI